MNTQVQIKEYINSQPEPKSLEMQNLHKLILGIKPKCKLWFLDGKDENGNINFSRPDIQRYRQWYLSPDIDLTKIKTKKKLVKYALFVLNSLKFPAPGIEYSRNKFRFHWISF